MSKFGFFIRFTIVFGISNYVIDEILYDLFGNMFDMGLIVHCSMVSVLSFWLFYTYSVKNSKVMRFPEMVGLSFVALLGIVIPTAARVTLMLQDGLPFEAISYIIEANIPYYALITGLVLVVANLVALMVRPQRLVTEPIDRPTNMPRGYCANCSVKVRINYGDATRTLCENCV